MAPRMMLEKLCLLWLFLQDQIIMTDSSITVYTTEWSTVNLTFEVIDQQIQFRLKEKENYIKLNYNLFPTWSENKKYDIVLRPDNIQFPIINATASDKGRYWIDYWFETYPLELRVTNISRPTSGTKHILAIDGSPQILHFLIKKPVSYRTLKEGSSSWSKYRKFGHFTMHVDLYIYDLTPEDEGFYKCSFRLSWADLHVVSLWFINQTDLKRIVGQEGKELEMFCTTNTGQYFTALKIETNGTDKAIGDNQSVSYLIVPDRTDHLTIYKCVDIINSLIMIEVKLVIRYAPVVKGRYTNETIECDCDGFPAIYSVYRLDQISKYGELVRSVNLNNETFSFNTEPFPYQRNGIYTCVVSNNIPDIDGKEQQTWSTNVVYKEFNNIVGIEGYEIVIESEVLDIDDFQIYRITAKNRLGESNYHFAIIDNESIPLSKNNRRYFMILCSIAAVLFVYMVINHVWLCAKHIKTLYQRPHNEDADHNYHTYDEIGTVSYRAVSNLPSSDSNANQCLNQTEDHTIGISTGANLISTVDNATELNDDFLDDGTEQRDVTEVQGQRPSVLSSDIDMSNTDLLRIPSLIIQRMDNTLYCNQTNGNTHTEPPSDQQSQRSDDSNSESLPNVMEGNAGDGYENPYQTVLQDHPKIHQYTQITIERNTSISSGANLQSIDVNTTKLNAIFPEDGLQQRDKTDVQVQRMSFDARNLSNTDLTLTSSTVIPSIQNIANSNHTIESIKKKEKPSDEKSQNSDDSNSRSSNNVMVGNVGDGYEHPYQTVLQDLPESHPYTEIIRERHNNISSTESDKSEE